MRCVSQTGEWTSGGVTQHLHCFLPDTDLPRVLSGVRQVSRVDPQSLRQRRRRREGLLFLRHFRGAKGDLDRGDSLTPLKLLEQSLSNLRDLARFAIGCHHQASPFAPPNVAFRSAKAAPPPLAVNTLSTRIPCVIHRFQTEILTSVSSSKSDLRRLSDARHGLLTLERQFTR